MNHVSSPSPEYQEWQIEEMEDLADDLLDEMNGMKVLGWYSPHNLIVKITPHRVVKVYWNEHLNHSDYSIMGGQNADEHISKLEG